MVVAVVLSNEGGDDLTARLKYNQTVVTCFEV